MPPEPGGHALPAGFVPGRHQLAAACLVLRCLGPAPQALDGFRAQMVNLPTDGLFSAEQLRVGEEILVSCGVAYRSDGAIRLTGEAGMAPDEVLTRYLEANPPAWLGGATAEGEISEWMIPQDDLAILDGVIGDLDRRDAILLAMGRRMEDRLLAALGREAEELVVRECRLALAARGRADLAERVLHASLVSDLLGYDVRTPRLGGGCLRLEVKRDGRSGESRRFFLSRNEFRMAERDPAWRLVLCATDDAGVLRVVGWLGGSELAPLMPRDGDGSRWESAEVVVPGERLVPGLPDLA